MTTIQTAAVWARREQPMNYLPVPLPAAAPDAVLYLALPEGSERIWCSDDSGAPTLRPLGGLGPKGHRPAGYLTPDDRILLDAGSSLPEHAIRYLRDFFTGPARHLSDLAAMPERLRHARTYGWCRRCENPHGKPHSRSCPHAGKLVGDKVH